MKRASGAAPLALVAAFAAGCALDLDALTAGSGAGGSGDGPGGDCCIRAGDSCAPCGLECDAADCDGGPCVLAAGEGVEEPVGVVAVGTYLFWTSSGGNRIRRLDLERGDVDDFVPSTPGPSLLVSNGTHVVWLAEDGIWQCPIAADDCRSAARTVAGLSLEASQLVFGIAVDADTVFWTQDIAADSGAPVRRCGLGARCDGDAANLSSNNSHPRGIAVEPEAGGSVYWATQEIGPGGGRILRMLKSAATDSELVTVASAIDFPWAVALSASDVLWTSVVDVEGSADDVLRCGKDGPTCRGEAFVPQADPSGPFIDRPLDLVVDDRHAIWTNNRGGTVMQCDLSGCAGYPLVVADGQLGPRGISARGSCVYWVDQTDGGRVLRAVKPAQ